MAIRITAAGRSAMLDTLADRVDAPLATPVNAAFTTATTGGTLAAGTYSYRVSATNAAGETLASTATAITTTGATSTVTVNWGAVAGATGYKVYGRVAGSELLIASVGAVTTYTDDGSITPAGALPAANTTARGTIKLYSGAPPANADAAATGTLLATFDLVVPAFDAASAGSVAIDADPDLTTTAVATGTAGYARVADASGAAVFDGVVGTTGTDFIITSTSITSGQTLTVTVGTITLPAS